MQEVFTMIQKHLFSSVGNVAGAIKSIKDAQKESHKLQAIK